MTSLNRSAIGSVWLVLSTNHMALDHVNGVLIRRWVRAADEMEATITGGDICKNGSREWVDRRGVDYNECNNAGKVDNVVAPFIVELSSALYWIVID